MTNWKLHTLEEMPGIPITEAADGMVIEGTFNNNVLNQYLESLMFDGRSGGTEYRQVGLISHLWGTIITDAKPTLLDEGVSTSKTNPLQASVTFEPTHLMGARDGDNVIDREGTWHPRPFDDRGRAVLPIMADKEVRFRGMADIDQFVKEVSTLGGDTKLQPIDQLPLYEPAYLILGETAFKLVTRPIDRPEPTEV